MTYFTAYIPEMEMEYLRARFFEANKCLIDRSEWKICQVFEMTFKADFMPDCNRYKIKENKYPELGSDYIDCPMLMFRPVTIVETENMIGIGVDYIGSGLFDPEGNLIKRSKKAFKGFEGISRQSTEFMKKRQIVGFIPILVKPKTRTNIVEIFKNKYKPTKAFDVRYYRKSLGDCYTADSEIRLGYNHFIYTMN